MIQPAGRRNQRRSLGDGALEMTKSGEEALSTCPDPSSQSGEPFSVEGAQEVGFSGGMPGMARVLAAFGDGDLVS